MRVRERELLEKEKKMQQKQIKKLQKDHEDFLSQNTEEEIKTFAKGYKNSFARQLEFANKGGDY